MYDGPNFQRIKMTEATVLDFEICVLEQYLKLLKLVKEQFSSKGLKDFYDEQKDLRSA